MVNEIVIIGAGGFAREMLFLLEDSVLPAREKWDFKGFIDEKVGQDILGYKVIGNDEWLLQYDCEINAIIGIGDPHIKRRVVEKLKRNPNIKYPNIIAETAKVGKNITMGEGCIIGDMNILTVDVCLGDFVTLNLSNTIGHGAVIGSYSTINPGCNISGDVTIGKAVSVGTGVKVIQGLNITDNVIIGAGTVVIRDVVVPCTLVGNPGKVIKNE